MNHPRSFLALFLFIQTWQLASAQPCLNNGNYTINSTYGVNLNATIQILHQNVDDNGYYNASTGAGSDRANALVLCRADAQLGECRDCILESSAELSTSCPLQKQAIRWDARCMLRYSDAPIAGVFDNRIIWQLARNQENSTNPVQFEEKLDSLLVQLFVRAASGDSLRKVAAGNVTGPDFQMIFALVQCTPDLSTEDCNSCLFYMYDNMAFCDDKIGCRVIGPNCNLRFETYSFYNETRIRGLERVVASPPLPTTGDPPSGKGNDNRTRIIVVIVVPIVLSLILAVSATVWLRKKREIKSTEYHLETDDDADEISIAESLQYAFSTIKTATNDFSEENKLGQGGFGSVYKGKLENGQEIAVKRLSMNSGQGDIEFKNEVMLLAKLQHRNLVRLLGFAIQGMEKLLIYELVQNASLDHFIFDRRNRSYLDWDRRYKIIWGIARGILYLHEDSRLRIIHRDLKASNVLLDRKMNPKIADFGMARLFGQDESQANTRRVVGTYGYMPPEYVIHGQFSIKSDVFSFGVLVLEIISGRKNNNFQSGEYIENLLRFAWKNWRKGTAANVVDPLLRSGSGSGSSSSSMNEMLRCIHIGLLCVQENSGDRPTMASVVIMMSSSTMSLALPSQPAFYYSSIDVSEVERPNQYDLQRPGDQSYHLSHNDISISELYPR